MLRVKAFNIIFDVFINLLHSINQAIVVFCTLLAEDIELFLVVFQLGLHFSDMLCLSCYFFMQIIDL